MKKPWVSKAGWCATALVAAATGASAFFNDPGERLKPPALCEVTIRFPPHDPTLVQIAMPTAAMCDNHEAAIAQALALLLRYRGPAEPL